MFTKVYIGCAAIFSLMAPLSMEYTSHAHEGARVHGGVNVTHDSSTQTEIMLVDSHEPRIIWRGQTRGLSERAGP